eukprot:3003606-Rhodomonas_salina.2
MHAISTELLAARVRSRQRSQPGRCRTSPRRRWYRTRGRGLGSVSPCPSPTDPPRTPAAEAQLQSRAAGSL